MSTINVKFLYNDYCKYIGQLMKIIYDTSNTNMSRGYIDIEKDNRTKEHSFLFSLILDNVRFSIEWFFFMKGNINYDYRGFPRLHRELRYTIEAYLDLYNLCNYGKNYKQVLRYCSNSNKESRGTFMLGDFESYMYNREFTIQSKYNISKLNNDLMEIVKQTNSFTHPDVYLDKFKIFQTKENLVGKIITVNLKLLVEAFDLFINHLKSYQKDGLILDEQAINQLSEKAEYILHPENFDNSFSLFQEELSPYDFILSNTDPYCTIFGN